jgi:GT2 family glycosyltransferase
MEKEVKFSIIIPNWNGQKLLEKNLPKVIAAVSKNCEIIVVDDASSDGSVEFLKKKFSQVGVLQHGENLGFGAACNTGVNSARGQYLVLLNSDVVPQKGFLEPCLAHFEDPQVFAVTFNEGKYGPGKLVWEKGFLEIEATSIPAKTSLTAWPNGGSSVFKKEIWLVLGGFDKLFLPFYFEDIDLGMRAGKAGFQCLWEPKAKVVHQHEATINKENFKTGYISSIKQRNHLLLTWKNIDSLPLIFLHTKGLLEKCLKHPGYLKIVFLALLRLATSGLTK